MQILSRADVLQAISMREAVEVMKDAFAQLSSGEANAPLRSQISVPAHNGIALFMPAHLKKTDALAIKIVTVYNDNPKRGLPLINAVVVALDAATGRALALMEGSYLTALRTGAGTGAATDFLARRDAHVGLVFGAGVQARTQLRSMAAVRSLERIYVFDMIPGKADELIRDVRGMEGVPNDLRSTNDVAQAVRAADIISCASTSSTPLFDGNDVRSGTHVNAIGSFTPEARETDTTFIKRCAKIVVDAYSGALAEAGDLLIPIEEGAISESTIYGELGEITSGQKQGRTSADEITFFKSVGNAVQDAAIAQAILERARAMNLGTEVEL